MTDRQNAAQAVDDGARASATHYPSKLHPGMFFRKRSACNSIELDTPQVSPAEITTDPYAAEGKRLAVEDRTRRGKPGYFPWRQSIGNDYYDEQDRLAGRVAANDNVRERRVVA